MKKIMILTLILILLTSCVVIEEAPVEEPEPIVKEEVVEEVPEDAKLKPVEVKQVIKI